MGSDQSNGKSNDCLEYDRESKLIKPQYVIEQLYEVTQVAKHYVTSDVGQHQMWAAQYYKFDKPRRWINSRRLGYDGLWLACRYRREIGASGF